MHNIAYDRGMFPEDFFEETTRIAGAKTRELKPKNPEARSLLAQLEKGVFAAVKAKFAKSVTFYIAEAEPRPDGEETILEEYVFNVRYGDKADDPAQLDGVTVRDGSGRSVAEANVRSRRHLDDEEHVRRAAGALIRRLCSMMGTLEPTDERHRFGIKLAYYSHTPDEYQPPFFEAVDPVASTFKPSWNALVGKVETRHHRMDLSIRTVLISDDNPEDDPEGDRTRREDRENEAPRADPATSPAPAPGAPRSTGCSDAPRSNPSPTAAHAEPRAVADAALAHVLADIPEFDEEEYHYAVADSQQPPEPDFSRPVTSPDPDALVRRRVADWIGSRAPGARVDAISAVDVFPDVPFKTLDSALLDLSRTGALSARGDGTYVMVSSSQGVIAAAADLSFGGLAPAREVSRNVHASAGGGAFGSSVSLGGASAKPPRSPFGRVGSGATGNTAAPPEFSFGSQEPIGGGSVGSVGGLGGAFGRPFARATSIVALTPVAFTERSGASSQEMRRGLDAFDDFNRMRESSRAPSAGSKRGPGPFLAAPSGYGPRDAPWKRRLRSSLPAM